jgi:hypothetical protein
MTCHHRTFTINLDSVSLFVQVKPVVESGGGLTTTLPQLAAKQPT